jgi:transposase
MSSKKLPEEVAAACLKNEMNLPVRLMFQDEARFGRMSDPRSCWAPAPHRPVVNLAMIREFRYEYAAVSPWDGCLDFMTADKMNTDNMSRFLAQASQAHQNEFIVMVLDGASSHKSKEHKIPNNVSLILLPPYSPELNPAEQIWNVLRRDYFANRVFDSLDAATEQAERGLSMMAANKSATRQLTNWPWISAILKT